jgi:hypothetical protein
VSLFYILHSQSTTPSKLHLSRAVVPFHRCLTHIVALQNDTYNDKLTDNLSFHK